MKCLTLIIASLLLTSVYGMNITNKTLSIDVDALPVGLFGDLEGEIDLFFRDGPYDSSTGHNSQLIIGNNGKIFDFDDYTISQNNYIIIDGDTYIHIPYFSSEAYVGLIDDFTGTTNQIASFSQSALSWSNGFDLEVGDWVFSNETFDITHNFAAINALNPNAEVIFADKMYFYSPESSFVEVPGEGIESALEVRPKSLIPAKGSIVETEIFNAYAADNTDYDIDMAYELDVFNFQAEEVCEVSINLEGPAGGDESGVLEWECYFLDHQAGEYGYLEYELDEDTFNKTEKIYKTKIRQYFDPVERFFIIDIKPTFMDESTLTDYVTLFKIGENDTIHYLVEDASSDAEYGSSSIAPISNETYQVNNYTYKVMTNNWGADFTFYRAEFEGGIEPEEDEFGDIENPSGIYPFSGNNTNLIGVSYFRVAEAPIADTITATEDHIAYNLPDIFSDNPSDYGSYSYGLIAQYFDRDHISGEYGDLIFRGPGEIYTQTLIHSMSSSMDSFIPISHDRYRMDIINGTLAREPLSEVDEALTETLEEYIYNIHASSNYSHLESNYSNLVYTYSATEGSIEYENGLIKKTYYIDSSDYDGINYSATLYAILTDKDLDLIEVWEATDYISTSLASAMDEIGSSVSATGPSFVYRFDPPESHELVVLDWSLELANALPNWPTNSNYGSGSPSPGNEQSYTGLNDVYTISNDRILLVYPADNYSNINSFGERMDYSYGTNGVVVSILNPDGSLHYSNVETYVPYSATIDEMMPGNFRNPPKRVGIKYVDKGAFYVSISFIEGSDNLKGAYSVLYYPTSNSYDRIVFDGLLIPNEDNQNAESFMSNNRIISKNLLFKPWPNHSQTLYTFNPDVTQLSKYSLSLDPLNTSSGVGDTPDLTSINSRVASLESDLPVLESTLIDYTDVSDNSLSNALILQINASISTFSNSVDWASISSVDTNEINSRIDGVSYINTLLANEVSQEIQNRSAAITALQDEINTLSGIVNNATNNPGAVSIEEAKSMMRDLRVGSSIIDVSNQQATITISLDQSSDLTSNWTENVMSAPMTIDTEDSEVQFYRIRMD